jgi:hypothetical protein
MCTCVRRCDQCLNRTMTVCAWDGLRRVDIKPLLWRAERGTPRPGRPSWLSPGMATQQGVPAAAAATCHVTESPAPPHLLRRLRQGPRVRAYAHQVLPALPPERPRGAAPWLDPALAGCRGARRLAPAATLSHRLALPAVMLHAAHPAKTMAPHLPSVAWATSPLTWRCCGRPKTAAAERLVVSQSLLPPWERGRLPRCASSVGRRSPTSG